MCIRTVKRRRSLDTTTGFRLLGCGKGRNLNALPHPHSSLQCVSEMTRTAVLGAPGRSLLQPDLTLKKGALCTTAVSSGHPSCHKAFCQMLPALRRGDKDWRGRMYACVLLFMFRMERDASSTPCCCVSTPETCVKNTSNATGRMSQPCSAQQWAYLSKSLL